MILELPYISPEQSDLLSKSTGDPRILLNAWTVQGIIYEVVVNHLLTNDPKSMGYDFTQRYNIDRNKSEIFVDLGFNWDAQSVAKRPAIFIQRGDAVYTSPVMKGQLGRVNFKESDDYKTELCGLTIYVKCIATNIGFTEQLADYIKQHILQHQYTIQKDFGFTKFRMEKVTKPEIYVEAKEHFIVVLEINTTFAETCVIHGDDLKIKTFSFDHGIFLANSKIPLLRQ